MASQEVDGNHSFFLAVAAPPLGAPGVSGGALSAARTSHLTQGSLSTFNQHRGRGSETRDCLCRLARSGPLGRLSGHCLVLLWCPGPVRGAGCRRHRAGGHSEPSAVSPAGGWGWPRQEPKGKGPAFCLKAGGHLPVASWFTRRSERELHHWGGCVEARQARHRAPRARGRPVAVAPFMLPLLGFRAWRGRVQAACAGQVGQGGPACLLRGVSWYWEG